MLILRVYFACLFLTSGPRNVQFMHCTKNFKFLHLSQNLTIWTTKRVVLKHNDQKCVYCCIIIPMFTTTMIQSDLLEKTALSVLSPDYVLCNKARAGLSYCPCFCMEWEIVVYLLEGPPLMTIKKIPASEAKNYTD